MEDQQFTVPDHYIQLAKYLKPVIAQIQDAFIKRPVPSGLPRERDLSDVWPLFDEIAVVLPKLEDALNAVNNKVLALPSVANGEIRTVAENLSKPVCRYIEIYYALWSRPFPAGLGEGVYMFSAGFERVLKQLLEGLERLIMIIEDPAKAVERYGTATIHFNLVFEANDEFNRAEEWLKNKTQLITCPRPRSVFGFGSAVIAFILGWLIGGNDEK